MPGVGAKRCWIPEAEDARACCCCCCCCRCCVCAVSWQPLRGAAARSASARRHGNSPSRVPGRYGRRLVLGL
eukprot:6068083-Alexandrium_andersonii.AAC.1